MLRSAAFETWREKEEADGPFNMREDAERGDENSERLGGAQ